MSAHPSPHRIMQTGLAFWASKTLLSAIEIGVFTELAHGPEAFDDLRGGLGLHPRTARDFLDALVALGLLTREEGGRVHLHPGRAAGGTRLDGDRDQAGAASPDRATGLTLTP